jgi:hypothetical protein
MGKLMERWMSDARFRADVQRDPAAAMTAAGIELDADALAAVQSMDWNVPDEELRARVSKCNW